MLLVGVVNNEHQTSEDVIGANKTCGLCEIGKGRDISGSKRVRESRCMCFCVIYIEIEWYIECWAYFNDVAVSTTRKTRVSNCKSPSQQTEVN
jgi:hypothetical protein